MTKQMNRAKVEEMVDEMRKHDIDETSMHGVVLMAQTSENADIILDYMKNHPEADQTEIMMLAYSLYKENNE